MRRKILPIVLLVALLVSCTPKSISQSSRSTEDFEVISQTQDSWTEATQTTEEDPDKPLPEKYGLAENEIKTLQSLVKVNDYPLYTMTFTANYEQTTFINITPPSPIEFANLPQPWACTLFVTLPGNETKLYGRNFDWHYSPSLLLFTKPEGRYASVSMVDLAYLYFTETDLVRLDDLTLEDRIPMLTTPWMPFDGMNEKGLVVGMAAVPPGDMTHDPLKLTVDSLAIIRIILDNAKNVEEALEIFNNYNIDYGSGPDLHYLIADRSGQAVLVEFFNGEMHTIYNQEPWHLATNFLCSAIEGSMEGNCWRYDKVSAKLKSSNGDLKSDQAMALLGEVAQQNTQWSILYQISTGQIDVVMGQQYEEVNSFQLYFSSQ